MVLRYKGIGIHHSCFTVTTIRYRICYDYKIQNIDKNKCITKFDNCYKKEKALITWIKAHKIKVLNSGIKIA